jgi:hypothetical protein
MASETPRNLRIRRLLMSGPIVTVNVALDKFLP